MAADLRVVSSADRSDVRAQAVLQAERWIISHEIAHHLLGHTVRHGKRLPARDVVEPSRNPSVVSKLNPRQAEEYDADLLAHLLLSGACRPDTAPTRFGLYRAATGSVMALVSVTHISGHWATTSGIEETPPGFDVRFQLISDVLARLSADTPVGPNGDHPMDLFIDLTLFVASAYDAARRRAGVGPDRRLTLLELADEALKRKGKLHEELEARRMTLPMA